MTRRNSFKAAAVIVVVAGAIGLGVLTSNGAEPSAGPGNMPAAPSSLPVDVAVIEAKPTRLWTEYSARLQAVNEVDIRPQVSGAITEVLFKDGERVEKGDILFVIDPRPYEAAVAEAKAQLAAARERQDYAAKELSRARSLIKSSAVSERVLDERANTSSVSRSETLAAQARLTLAEVDLDHAFVKAPIAGRVSRAEITEGNLVQAGPGAPLLTSIVSDTEIYADFEVDERTYLGFLRAGVRSLEEERAIPVKLLVGTDAAMAVDGHIHSFDNRINPSTGTIRARALFSNTEAALLPGMFVQVKLGSPGQLPALLLSESAIMTDQDRKFVYVIDAEGKAAYRQVTLGATVDGKRVISHGLSEGDRVITSNLMAVRPSVPVTPKS